MKRPLRYTQEHSAQCPWPQLLLNRRRFYERHSRRGSASGMPVVGGTQPAEESWRMWTECDCRRLAAACGGTKPSTRHTYSLFSYELQTGVLFQNMETTP